MIGVNLNATLFTMYDFYIPPLKYPRFYLWRKPDWKCPTATFKPDQPTVNPNFDMVFVDWITEKALSKEELRYYYKILNKDPILSLFVDRVVFDRAKFRGGGLVVGYDKRGVADEIPADLERGGFVISKKAVDEIGVETLYKMLHEADQSTA